MFLRKTGKSYDAVDWGCSVKQLLVQGRKVQYEEAWYSLDAFAFRLGLHRPTETPPPPTPTPEPEVTPEPEKSPDPSGAILPCLSVALAPLNLAVILLFALRRG
jgi:hypothetical protein